jgi:hypothetical protein
MWAKAPTGRNSSGGTSQRLVVATDLLLLLFVFAAALSSGFCIRLASSLCVWDRLRMLGMPFCSPVAFVHQAKELEDIFHFMCG